MVHRPPFCVSARKPWAWDVLRSRDLGLPCHIDEGVDSVPLKFGEVLGLSENWPE
jgi:hypothetical protein